MKKNYKFILSLFLVLSGSLSNKLLKAQSCSFTGLSPNYCVNSPSSALTTTATGGAFMGNGVIGSAFSPSLAGPGTATVSYAICTNNYSLTSGTYSPLISTTVGTSATDAIGDDVLSGAKNIGFNFVFYCQTYTQFYIGSNGFITFSYNGGANGCCSGAFLPSTATPNNLIAYGWTDLYPGNTTGTITYTTIGTAPNRRCIVNFDNIPFYGYSTSLITAQIVLYETTNVIEIHTNFNANTGQTKTMGIEDGGTNGSAVSGRNSTTWGVTNPEMQRWTPMPGCISTQTTFVSPTTITVLGSNQICTGGSTTLTATGNTTYTWTSPSSNSSTIVVNPTSNTTYSVSGTNSFGCVAQTAITVSVFPGLPTVGISASTSSACIGQSVILTGTGAPNFTWSGGISNGVPFSPSVTTNYVLTGANGCGTSTAAITITIAPLAVSAAASASVICSGVSVSLTATSAATSYTWLPGPLPGSVVIVTPTVNTTYTVSVSNGTCTGNTTLALAPNPNPTVTSSSSPSSICQGASAILTASGALSYTWNPGLLTGNSVTVTPTSSTQYSVVGSNTFGCTNGSAQSIIVKPLPNLNVNVTDPLVCSSGTSGLIASGASTYSWNTSATTSSIIVTPTQTSIYTVTGTGTNQCSTAFVVTVSVFIPPVSITGPTTTCAGKGVTLTASGADNYLWTPGGTPFSSVQFTPNTSVTYTLSTSTSSGIITCTDIQVFNVQVLPNPTVGVTSVRSNICTGEKETITASGGSTYTWNPGSTNGSTVAATSSVVAVLVYTVTGTAPNNCTAKNTITIRVNSCSGLIELNSSFNSFNLYPNPNHGTFNLESASNIDVSIFNELGQQIKTVKLNDNNSRKVTVNDLPSGIYFVQSGETRTKVIVEK